MMVMIVNDYFDYSVMMMVMRTMMILIVVLIMKRITIMPMIIMMIVMKMNMVMCRIYWRGRLVGDNCFEYKFSQRQ